MDRVFESGAAATPPDVPASPSTGYATGGNPGAAVPATKPGPWWYHMITEEIRAVIEAAGLAPDHEDLGQLARAIQSSALQVAAADGTADAITAAYTPAITALTDGMVLHIRAAGANTVVAPTFTPADGTIAAKSIVKGNNLPLVAGDIAGAAYWAELQYDVTLDKWVLLNPATGVLGTLQVATAGEAQAQTENTKAITPLRLKESLQGANQSLAASGYQKLPGGLILQWGKLVGTGTLTGTVITFPVAFPTACLFATNVADTNATINSSVATGQMAVNAASTTQFTSRIGAVNGYWFALGY